LIGGVWSAIETAMNQRAEEGRAVPNFAAAHSYLNSTRDGVKDDIGLRFTW